MASPSSSDIIPGYDFNPTNEQLLGHYLAQRINDYFNGSNPGTNSHLIPDVELYGYDPKELPRLFRSNSEVRTNGRQWFFFCQPIKKYRNSKRNERTVLNVGYWKTTGTERTVSDDTNGAVLGIKRTLVFHKGRVPKGVKTGWAMHEYHLDPAYLGYDSSIEMPFVVCRIKKKNDDDDDNDDDNDNGDHPTEYGGNSSNHGTFETQAPPPADENYGSYDPIQNNNYQTYGAGTDEGSYWNGTSYYQNGFSSYDDGSWMPASNDNYQHYPNNWNPYN